MGPSFRIACCTSSLMLPLLRIDEGYPSWIMGIDRCKYGWIGLTMIDIDD